jgi:hypothetical protein
MFDDSHSLQEFCEQNLLCEMAPLLPLGEKVADRPDEGLLWVTSLPNGPLTPALSPKFFARMLPCEATQNPQKTRG